MARNQASPFRLGPFGLYQVPFDTIPGQGVFQPKFSDGVAAAPASGVVATVLPWVLGDVFHGNTGIVVDQGHPATAGEVLVMYASGMGPTNPTVAAGVAAPANPLAVTTNSPQVTIGDGNALAQVQFSGLTPGLVGVYQINFVLPPALGAGAQLITIAAAGQSLGATGTIFTK